MSKDSPQRPAPLVLLPGLDGTGTLFSPLIRALSDKTEPVTISYPPDPQMSYESITEHVISRLPDAPCLLLCESFSGPIGVRITARFPKRIVGLVFVSSFIASPRPRWLNLVNDVLPVRLVPEVLIDLAMLSSATPKEARQKFQQVSAALSSSLVHSRMKQVLACDERAAFGKTKCPVLVLWGNRDRLIPRSAADLITAIRPDAKVVVLDGPHQLLQSRPDEVAQAIKSFAESASLKF